MFSFLQKKYFLVDYLSDFTDIHNHILPGLDDGAQDLEASLLLLERFGNLGIKNFIATPHIMNDFYPNTPDKIETALEILQTELRTRKKIFKIKAAAEYMMDQTFLVVLDKENLLCLADNLVLVEMSYFQPPINLNEILFQIQTRQYRPVLAHPERYAFFHSKNLGRYYELKNRGCLFQLNILSLTGHYGGNIQATAFKLLEHQMVDFLGTDTHQLRHLDKLSEVRLKRKQLDLVLPVIERTKATFSF